MVAGVDATHMLETVALATGATAKAEAEAASAINPAAELIGLVVADAVVAAVPAVELVVDAVDVDKRVRMIESVGVVLDVGVLEAITDDVVHDKMAVDVTEAFNIDEIVGDSVGVDKCRVDDDEVLGDADKLTDV